MDGWVACDSNFAAAERTACMAARVLHAQSMLGISLATSPDGSGDAKEREGKD